MSAQARLAELGIELPTPMAPAGLYRSAVRVGDLLFCSGAGPVLPDGSFVRGKVGGDIDLAAGRDAARLVGLQLLAAMHQELGSLDAVSRIVKLLVSLSATTIVCGRPTDGGIACPTSCLAFSGSLFARKNVRKTSC